MKEMKQRRGRFMKNRNLNQSFKSIQIPIRLWRKLERVAVNLGLSRNLILRMGFCYEIETTKGLSADFIQEEDNLKTISKEVLFGENSQLFFDLFYVWHEQHLKDNEVSWNSEDDCINEDELEIFKKIILSGGDHICNKLLKGDDSAALRNLKKLIG